MRIAFQESFELKIFIYFLEYNDYITVMYSMIYNYSVIYKIFNENLIYILS